MKNRPMVLIFAGLMLGAAAVDGKILLAAVFILSPMTVLACQKWYSRTWVMLPAVFLAGMLFYIQDFGIKKEITQKNWQSMMQYQAEVENISKTSNGYTLLLKHPNLEGKILLYCLEETNAIPGDCIDVKASLKQQEDASNPGQFSAKDYYLSKGIYYYSYTDHVTITKRSSENISNSLFQARRFITKQLHKQYDDQTAALLQGMILGDKSEISRDVKVDFKESGLIHILAVSGLHISMTGGGLYRLFRKIGVGLWVSTVAGFCMAAGYSILAGMSISSVRAVLMLGCFLLGQVLGKSYDMLSSAAFAGSVIFLWNPYCVFDTGFILSFTAVFVIGFFQEVRTQRKRDALVFPLAVQIGMLPVTTFFQYQVPVLSFLANAVVIPMISAVFPVAILGIGCPPFILHRLIEMVFRMIFWISERRFGLVTIGSVPVFWIFIWYGTLYLMIKIKDAKFFTTKLCFIYFNVLILLWIPMYRVQTLAFLDVGQGDCMAADTDGGMIMVDGGSSSKKHIGAYCILPYVHYTGHGDVEIAIITHLDEDHYSGIMELLQMGRIHYLGMPEVEKDKAYHMVEAAAKKAGTEVFYLSEGKKITGNDFNLEVLHPKKDTELDKNAASIVIKGEILGRKVLLTGDVEKEGEEELMEASLEQTEILKVAHHGSKFSTSSLFLDKVMPKYSIISCGKENRYGHPHGELMNRLKQTKTDIFRTDQNGAVIFQEKR